MTTTASRPDNHPADVALVLRPAHSADAGALARLAALDGQPPVRGSVLVAEHGGAIVAAIELATGRAVADPFRRTAEHVALLRVRARLLRAAGARGREGAARRSLARGRLAA